ncbi:MAG TPA: hypothetical protein VKQ29_00510 [Aliidongia sp.]|nr:hypothetical protein [Aliidongia sp.]
MDDVAIARALHVLAVVVWVGGVAMVTTVFLPLVRRSQGAAERLALFDAVEQRFIGQARVATIVVALTGFYMVWRLNLWDRFSDARFWWMHAMVCVWALFSLVLFVLEPLILHRLLHRRALASSDATFALLHRAHWLLLGLSLVTVFAAVAGSNGMSLSF